MSPLDDPFVRRACWRHLDKDTHECDAYELRSLLYILQAEVKALEERVTVVRAKADQYDAMLAEAFDAAEAWANEGAR